MKRFVYIHGFNSGAQSRSGRELGRLLGVEIICPEYDYARPFAECLASIRRQILEAIDGEHDSVCLMGSSLGGFYALMLRHPSIVHVAAWNPVVFPTMQLEQFLGMNTRFSDGGIWEFTRETLLSYAQAPDPRPWYNDLWMHEESFLKDGADTEILCFHRGDGRTFSPDEKKQGISFRRGQSMPRRDIFLGDSDEILDARLSRAFWQGSACLHDIVSGHQILDYSHAVDILKSSGVLKNFLF